MTAAVVFSSVAVSLRLRITNLTDEQYKSFEKGDFYVNVHSSANPGGEIRAQLKP